MPQIEISYKLAFFLNTQVAKIQKLQNPNDQEWIENSKKLIKQLTVSNGLCHAYVVSNIAMRWADTHSMQELPKNLLGWQKMLDAIKRWDEVTDPATILIDLPIIRPGDEKSSGSVKTKLIDIFEIVLSALIYNHAAPGYPPLADTTQRNFFLPESKESKSTPITKFTRRFDLSMPIAKESVDELKGDSEILKPQVRYSMGGHLPKSLLLEILDEKTTQAHIHEGMCMLYTSSHRCSLWFDKEKWWFYNPNYDDDCAHCFTTTEELIEEIYTVLSKNFNFELVHLITPTVKNPPFQAFTSAIKTAEGTLPLIQSAGLTTMARGAIWALPQVLSTLEILPKEDFTVKDQEGYTALHWAVLWANEVAVEKLINARIDINAQDEDHCTALLYAVANNLHAIVAQLIAAEANTDLSSKGGSTALHYAVRNQNVIIVMQLLKARTRIDTRDVEDRTPLHWAVINNDEVIAKQLIAAGANCDLQDNEGCTALQYAVKNKRSMLVAELLKARALTDIPDKDGYTPLHYAVNSGSSWIIEQLVRARANVNVPDNFGRTALHWAEKNKDDATIALLLRARVHIDTQDKDERTALHYASLHGNDLIANQLIMAGAQIDLRDKDGRVPLHWAAGKGHPTIVTALLEAGADINHLDKLGNTALHWAVMQEQLPIAEQLVKAGVDSTIINIHGDTALDKARKKYTDTSPEFLQLLRLLSVSAKEAIAEKKAIPPTVPLLTSNKLSKKMLAIVESELKDYKFSSKPTLAKMQLNYITTIKDLIEKYSGDFEKLLNALNEIHKDSSKNTWELIFFKSSHDELPVIVNRIINQIKAIQPLLMSPPLTQHASLSQSI